MSTPFFIFFYCVSPPACWHELIGDATVADVILDRLSYGAHRIELKGESMRKHSRYMPSCEAQDKRACHALSMATSGI